MMEQSTRRRTLIFGIDGGTWLVLEPLLARGVMPTLKQLRDHGAWGDLQSTVPVNSAAAWSSMLTGISPEKHGVTDFLAWNPHTHTRTSVNATWLPKPNILDLMGQDGPVLSLKVPMTYPPWAINGVMVSGLPTPDDESAFTHPVALATHLNPLIEKGSAGRSWEQDLTKRDVILDQMEAAHRVLERMTDLILKEEQPQSCFVVARDIDELQHFFWDALSGNDRYGYLPRIEEYFRGIDAYLARMIDWAGKDARIVIHSDHGFGPVEGVWHLNDWLHQRGFLTYHKNHSDSSGSGYSLAIRLNFALRRRMARQLKKLGMNTQRLENSLEELKLRSQSQTDLQAIDWENTLAYTGNVGEEYLPVYINLQGREPFGSVRPDQYDKVRSDLMHLLTHNEEPAVLAVHRAEEIFQVNDPLTSAAPDLVIETISGAVQSDFSMQNETDYEPSRFRIGCHRRQGMYVLSGPDVERGYQVARLLDIPPTVLAWMGIQPPAHFEGQILKDFLPGVTVEKSLETEAAAAQRQYLSADDEAGVRKKLESLGYL